MAKMNNLKNAGRALAALALITTFGFAHEALAKKEKDKGDDNAVVETGKCQFKASEINESPSQFIRSNPGTYWCWAKHELPLSPIAAELGKYLKGQGVIAGDPHLGNFNVIPVTVDGKRVFKFLNIDFDDAGIAPFALDFIRLGVALAAEKQLDLTTEELVEAYVAGLNLKDEMKPPKRVKEALATTLADYDKMVDKWVGGQSELNKKGELVFRQQKDLIPYKFDVYSRSEIENLFPHAKLRDVAIRPSERGGSTSDKPRLWMLVEENGRNRIYELKPYELTNIEQFQHQTPTLETLKAVRAAYWPGIDPSSYTLVQPTKGEFAWLREKKRDLYAYERNSDIKKEQEFIKDLSLYIAFTLGQAHGRQASSVGYKNVINEDPLSFAQAAQPAIEQFIQKAKKARK